MTASVPTARADQTLGEVHEQIIREMKGIETINYVYVLDGARKLIGIFSIKDLYRFPARTKVASVYKRASLVTVKPTTDQEHVVYLALQHNIKAIPVVSQDHTFLGVIPSDTILTILNREAHEDLLRLAGVHHRRAMTDNILTLPILESLEHRLPWLFIGLVGGLFAARIIGSFEQTLEQNLILAAFIPLIVYLSDAVGTQVEVFLIRDLAIDRHLAFRKYCFRQTLVIGAIAVIFSLLIFSSTFLWYGNANLSAVLGLSLFAAVASSLFTGLLVPYCFYRLRLDPANASGPLATIIQDLLSIVIYFAVASALL